MHCYLNSCTLQIIPKSFKIALFTVLYYINTKYVVITRKHGSETCSLGIENVSQAIMVSSAIPLSVDSLWSLKPK